MPAAHRRHRCSRGLRTIAGPKAAKVEVVAAVMALLIQLVSTATLLLLPDSHSHQHHLSSLAWAIEPLTDSLTEAAIPTEAAWATKPEVPQEMMAAVMPLSKASQQGSCKGASAVVSLLVAPVAAVVAGSEGTRTGVGAGGGVEAEASLTRPVTRISCQLK